MSRLALLLVFSSCAVIRYEAALETRQTPECITTCGLRAPIKGCQTLQDLESLVLINYDRFVVGWDANEMCSALSGWKVSRHSRTKEDMDHCHDGWQLWDSPSKARCVVGLTDPSKKEISLYSLEYAKSNVLMHEMAHVFDFAFHTSHDHCNWESNGVRAAMKETYGVWEESQGDFECPLSEDNNH